MYHSSSISQKRRDEEKRKSCLENKITLIEGNHKIAWAKKNNIPYVPVVMVTNDDNKNLIVAPSEIGITTFQSFPDHPYLGPLATKYLKEHVFKDPYDIGMDELLWKMIMSTTNPNDI